MKQIITTHSPEDTEGFARSFAQKLKAGDTIALCGELGAGKTTFVRGLFEGLGGDTTYSVTSPTFTLMNDYPTQKGRLYHFDLYRFENNADLRQIDFDDYLHSEEGFVLVEWADKFPTLASQFTYCISLTMQEENSRTIEIVKN